MLGQQELLAGAQVLYLWYSDKGGGLRHGALSLHHLRQLPVHDGKQQVRSARHRRPQRQLQELTGPGGEAGRLVRRLDMGRDGWG